MNPLSLQIEAMDGQTESAGFQRNNAESFHIPLDLNIRHHKDVGCFIEEPTITLNPRGREDYVLVESSYRMLCS